jgi:hypothetical protein
MRVTLVMSKRVGICVRPILSRKMEWDLCSSYFEWDGILSSYLKWNGICVHPILSEMEFYLLI